MCAEAHIFLFIRNACVELLQGFHRELAVALCGTDAFHGRLCSRHRRDIRDAVLDRRLADVAVVRRALFAKRRIDDQLDLAVCHLIQNVGATR